MMSGGAPKGEIAAIRELMPKAHITAVDKNQDCVDAAIDAGADEVFLCDLTDWSRVPEGRPGNRLRPVQQLVDAGTFDLMNIDLCAGASFETAQIFRCYNKLLTDRGVMIGTFSYGRDVVEAHMAALKKWRTRAAPVHGSQLGIESQLGVEIRRTLQCLEATGMPESVLSRLAYLFWPSELARTRSVMVYRGAEMPMCSFLRCSGACNEISFLQVESGDFELAVCYPDSARLYDCPTDRILALRRRFAALKAALTRSENASAAAVV